MLGDIERVKNFIPLKHSIVIEYLGKYIISTEFPLNEMYWVLGFCSNIFILPMQLSNLIHRCEVSCNYRPFLRHLGLME